MPTFSATTSSRSDPRAGTSSPSPPPSPPPERPLSALTPTNTFAYSRNGSIVAENNALAEDLASELSFAEALADDEMSSDDILDHVETSDRKADDVYEAREHSQAESDLTPNVTQSEPDLDRAMDSGRMLARSTSQRTTRSASMPSRPLRSALARSPPPGEDEGARHGSMKRAHFDDGTTTTYPAPYQSWPSHTAQDHHGLVEKLVDQPLATHQRSASDDLISNSSLDNAELAAAIGVFKEVVEELVEVAEEHAEAHSQLASVAREVADLIFESRTRSQDSDPHDGSTISDMHDETVTLLPRSGSSADLDVDESCMGDSSTSESDCETQDEEDGGTLGSQLIRSKPEVVFMTAEGEIRKPDLETILEERNFSTETLRPLSSRTSDVGLERRMSDPEANAAFDEELPDHQRRVSMSDAAQLLGRLKLLPFSAKTGPAAPAVTACSVRVAEPAKLAELHGYMDDGDRRGVASSYSTKTAQTEEPVTPGSSDVLTFCDRPNNPGVSTPVDAVNFPAPPSPMQKVKTKLAVWSWAKEQGLDARDCQPRWMELLDPDGGAAHLPPDNHSPRAEEQPLTPPNSSQHTSVAWLSPRYSSSPAAGPSPKQSSPSSPSNKARFVSEAIEDDDEEPLLELKAKSTHSRTPDSKTVLAQDYLDLPVPHYHSAPTSPSEPLNATLPRQLSNLLIEETHFTAHRNSVDLIHDRERHEAKVNHNLMNAQDSYILTKSKFDESYPHSLLDVRPAWVRANVMTPITDGSPPDARRAAGVRAMAKVGKSAAQAQAHRRVAEFDADEGEHLR